MFDLLDLLIGSGVPPAVPAIDFASVDLLGQAGGGGGFGGGGGGGGGIGGGGGGGGGGGHLIYLLIRFTIRYPHLGIPLIIAIVTALYFVKKWERDARVTRTIRRGRKIQEATLQDAALQQLTQRDPQFHEDLFLQRATNAFLTTQAAWSEQDLKPCRAFISDGVHERFELYIAMQRRENIRNRMRDVVVAQREVVAVTSDPQFDTMHVRFTAQAISYNEDLDSGRRVSGNSDRVPITFTEIWSFSRRPGVVTNPQASLLQGTCPNCGGPVEIVDTAQCPQCESVVNSGRYDWVLAEITQDEEWVVPPVRHDVEGWDQLAGRDLGLNFQHLEDRASVVFWRCLMAVYFEDLRYAAPILDAELNQIPPRWHLEAGQFWKTPAVGVVEVTECRPAGEDGFDRVAILVRWSATRAAGDRRRPKLLDQQRIYSHLVILRRKSGVTTNVNRTFSSFSCQGCGAPIQVGKAQVCEFCQAPLNDGSTAWVLETVEQQGALAAYRRGAQQAVLTQATGDGERLEAERFLNEPELLAALTRMVLADGELHEKERQYLTELARRRGVSMDRLRQIFATAVDDKQPIQLPEGREQRVAFMDHLIRAALIDGRLTAHEKQLLRRVGEQLNWTPADFNHAIARNRGKLYRQAREVIRANKAAQRG